MSKVQEYKGLGHWRNHAHSPCRLLVTRPGNAKITLAVVPDHDPGRNAEVTFDFSEATWKDFVSNELAEVFEEVA